MEQLRCAGFRLLESHRHEFLRLDQPKAELFDGFQRRLCSGFSMFTDEEIEEGIREVDSKYPGHTVTYTDVRDFIVGCKLEENKS